MLSTFLFKFMKRWLIIILFLGITVIFLCIFGNYQYLAAEERLNILTQRKKILHRVCQNINKSQTVHLEKLVVYDKHNLILCKLAKAGSQYWRKLIENQGHKTKGKSLVEYSSAEQEYRLKNYFKVMVVREPFGRLWSAYNDKFVNMNYKFIRTYQHVQHVFRTTNITVGLAEKNCQKHVEFEDFIKYISWEHLKSRKTPNPHWRTYFKACSPCHVQYDFIGKLETFPSDLKTFRHITNMKPPDSGKDGKEGLIEAACRPPFKNASVQEMLHCGKPDVVKNAVLQHWYNVGIINSSLFRKLIYYSEMIKGQVTKNSRFNMSKENKEYHLHVFINKLKSEQFNHTIWVNSCQNILSKFLEGSHQLPNIKYLKGKLKKEAFTELPSQVLLKLLMIYKVDFELFDYDYRKYLLENKEKNS